MVAADRPGHAFNGRSSFRSECAEGRFDFLVVRNAARFGFINRFQLTRRGAIQSLASRFDITGDLGQFFLIFPWPGAHALQYVSFDKRAVKLMNAKGRTTRVLS